MRRLHDNQSGLTLVELLIVMIVTTVVSGAILFFAIDFWGSNATLQNDLETYVTRSNAGDSLREALNVSSGLMMQNSLPDAHPMAPDPYDATGNYWETIHAVPGAINTPSSGNYAPVVYYQSPATDSDKNILMNGEQPYENQFILYLNGATKQLLLRSIAVSGATGNVTKSSCPAASASASCPADKIIASDVSSVDMRYFSRSGNLIDHESTVAIDPNTGLPYDPPEYIGPDFTAVEVVEFNIHLFRKATIQGTQDTINSTIIRVAIRNR